MNAIFATVKACKYDVAVLPRARGFAHTTLMTTKPATVKTQTAP